MPFQSKLLIPVYKTCPVCQNEFPVCPPGRSSRKFRRKFDTVFCSQECFYKGRFRHGDSVQQLAEAQAAYVAGFLDGEGSVMIIPRKTTFHVKVGFANTHLPTLEILKEWFGVGHTITAKRENPAHKMGHLLCMHSDTAYSLLTQIEPYVITKKEQVRLAIDFHRRLHDPALKADRSWQIEYRDKMQSLNRRGSKPRN